MLQSKELREDEGEAEGELNVKKMLLDSKKNWKMNWNLV